MYRLIRLIDVSHVTASLLIDLFEMPSTEREFRLEGAVCEVYLHVAPAIPSLMLLIAYASKRQSTRKWEDFWHHPKDPLSRIGRNWPRHPCAVSFFKSNFSDTNAHLKFLNNFYDLGSSFLAELQSEEQELVASAVSASQFEQTFELSPGHFGTVVRQSLPDDFAFPFIKESALICTFESPRLIGLRIVHENVG